MEIATQAFASALLDGMDQIARTTLTSVPLPIAATANAGIFSTISRASVPLDGMEMTAKMTLTIVQTKTVAKANA